MSQPREKMQAMLKSQSTEALVEILKKMNRATETHEILLTTMVSTELEGRMEEQAFLDLMAWCEADLAAA